MNLICLEECFDHLDMGELVKVADVNERFRKAAQSVYLQKYRKMGLGFMIGTEYICFNGKGIRLDQYGFCIYPDSSYAIIANLKIALQLLRCFGQLITDVWYQKSSAKCRNFVFIYLNEYCAESLINFRISEVSSDQLKLFTRTFKKVETVTLSKSFLVENGWFKKTFPNIQYFINEYNYGNNDYDTHNISCVTDHFPQLEQFDFFCLLDSTKENMKTVLRLNPQLKRLTLFDGAPSKALSEAPFFDFDTFRSLIEPMQNLRELSLAGKFASFSNHTDNKIQLKSVKRFQIFGDKLVRSFLFEQLEYFFITGCQLMDDVYDFIKQHQTIKTLRFRETNEYLSFSSNINMPRLIDVIPQLTEIQIDYETLMPVDDVVYLVTNFKSLEKFSLRHICPRDLIKNWRKELRERLQDEWNIPAKYRYSLRMERHNRASRE